MNNISHFEYFNPSPLFKTTKSGKIKRWHRGDCAVRAVCAATGMSWIDVYKAMTESALKVYEPFNCTNGFEQCMSDLGFVKVSYKRGEKRETVNDFATNHPNTVAILSLSGHYVCCRNGKYLDVWDCGYKTAYCYYVKQL